MNCLVGNTVGLDLHTYESINAKTLNNEAVFSSEILAATCWKTPCHIDTETRNIPKVF